MSYIVAFVKFAGVDYEFPMQCFRTDLSVNDEVIVRRADGKLRHATVSQIRYLNWDCNGRVECKRSESSLDCNGNIILPKGSPLLVGISTSKVFIESLQKAGWVFVKSRHRMHRTALANFNATEIAYILIRKNGIDIQLVSRDKGEIVIPYSTSDRTLTEGRVVRHSLAHTSFNLYEGILRFSKSFLSNENNLDRYFVPQGSTDKRTDKLKEIAESRRLRREEYGIGVIGEYSDDMIYGYHCR